MTRDTLISLLESISNRKFTKDQVSIINHQSGPGWVLGGPGSSKTEVLTILVLCLLLVEKVPPESIFVTTFTNKAARNLEDRISYYITRLVQLDSSLAGIDISKLRSGTLHSLCNDILQEYRYPGYQNVRLMSEFEQAMFIYENSNLSNSSPASDLKFWKELEFMFTNYTWKSRNYLPGRWERTKAAVRIFSRIVEDRVSLNKMKNAGGYLRRLVDAFEEYRGELVKNYRCDFPFLLKEFYEFLDHPLGKMFIDGNGNDYAGIKWVLVDEYQDTNLMQEAIYLKLASQKPHNIVVVGDDDQALYRFRGGSVECMVTFDEAINLYLGVPKSSIKKYPLIDNFRSHPKIVEFCNQYIKSFTTMNIPGARVTGKPDLHSRRDIKDNYEPLCTLSGTNIPMTAALFADAVKGLIDNKIVNSPNQICLLLRSTKETRNNAGPFVQALRDKGIPVYNPRNKAYLEQEEIQAVLGAIIQILDPNLYALPAKPVEIGKKVNKWIAVCNNAAKANGELRDYLIESRRRIKAAAANTYLTASLAEILYIILGHKPFSDWLKDPVRRVRLGRLTQIIENYSSIPVQGYPDLSRGRIKLSSTKQGEISYNWLTKFYYLFIGYVTQTGLDDVEDEEVICPVNMVPVMTIHQAKGLEFPIVFVGQPNTAAEISDSHQLEDILGQFPINNARVFKRPSQKDRAVMDLIRQYFVAYSRPEFALIILGTNDQLSQGGIPCGPDSNWLKRRTINI
jgi:DNA helicase-2/ATP-dependent DNA helicase PcrA